MTDVINELITVRDFLRWAASRFNEAGLYYGHGTDNAWDEAVALVMHALHLPLDTATHVLDARLTLEEKHQILELLQKRIVNRIPVPYVTHEAWFAGLSFYVDERVLIPRSPIAELIETQFQPWVEPDAIDTILDLCTGSGCIAITCAKSFPYAQVDAVDISADALAVAKLNVSRHEAENQVHLYQSNLLDGLPEKKYDIIVSNPPYVDAIDMAALPKEYRHEPAIGLEAGKEGLDIVLKILQQAQRYLNTHGILVVEVGNSEVALSEKFPEIPFTWIEFQRGGGGVFMLTQIQLANYRNVLTTA